MRGAPRELPPLWRLWFGLLGAAAAWALQLVASYTLVAHACFPGAMPVGTPVIPGARVLALVMGAAALGLGVAALLVALGAWRETRPPVGAERESGRAGERRSGFMALAGMFTSTVFIIAIVMNAFPLFVGPLCVVAR
jgi:hypothetical protein